VAHPLLAAAARPKTGARPASTARARARAPWRRRCRADAAVEVHLGRPRSPSPPPAVRRAWPGAPSSWRHRGSRRRPPPRRGSTAISASSAVTTPLRHDGAAGLARDPLEDLATRPSRRAARTGRRGSAARRRSWRGRTGAAGRGDLEADAQVALALREPRRVDVSSTALQPAARLREDARASTPRSGRRTAGTTASARRGSRDLLVRARAERRDGHSGARCGRPARRRALRRRGGRAAGRRPARRPPEPDLCAEHVWSPSRSRTRRRGRGAGTSSARRPHGSRAASTRRPSRR
jgi:hypothetical protein